MSQNINLEAKRKDFRMVHVNQNLKDELRNSHFHMGHFKTNFNTATHSQFQQRDKLPDTNNFAANNRKCAHKMGSDKVVYDSEQNIKFISPLNYKDRQ